jgi:hypothetical protein
MGLNELEKSKYGRGLRRREVVNGSSVAGNGKGKETSLDNTAYTGEFIILLDCP